MIQIAAVIVVVILVSALFQTAKRRIPALERLTALAKRILVLAFAIALTQLGDMLGAPLPAGLEGWGGTTDIANSLVVWWGAMGWHRLGRKSK